MWTCFEQNFHIVSDTIRYICKIIISRSNAAPFGQFEAFRYSKMLVIVLGILQPMRRIQTYIGRTIRRCRKLCSLSNFL